MSNVKKSIVINISNGGALVAACFVVWMFKDKISEVINTKLTTETESPAVNSQDIKHVLMIMRDVKHVARKYGWLDVGSGGFSEKLLKARHRECFDKIQRIEEMIVSLPEKDREDIDALLQAIKEVYRKYGWMNVGPGGWSQIKIKNVCF